MPYRRLPNTDAARLKALKAAYKKGKELPPFKLAYSQSTYQKVQSFLPAFEKAIETYKHGYAHQVEKNKGFHRDMKKARLYISHFIQVMNMAIIRGELSEDIRRYFKLEKYGKKLPALGGETDIIKWGKILIDGENERRMKGLTPITNPTIAVVKVRYEKFLEAYSFQKTLQKSNSRHLDSLSNLRRKADDIILEVWNEVESKLEDLNDNQKRIKAQDYGLVYVFRKNEMKEIGVGNIQRGLNLNILG